jgi:hypothetical protein
MEAAMYSVMADADGKFVLTYSGYKMPFWFSDHRFDTEFAAWFSPDWLD